MRLKKEISIENFEDENGKRYGQDALGQWLLVDVLGLKERKQVKREWLEKRGQTLFVYGEKEKISQLSILILLRLVHSKHL